jgi:hypothetical protein
MNKLLEEGAASEAQLWSVARVMSGEEFQQAAEERAIAGLCGNPLCSEKLPTRHSGGPRYCIDSTEKKVYEVGEGSLCCSAACAEGPVAIAARLGNASDASRRFESMLTELREKKRKEKEVSEDVTTTAGPDGDRAEQPPTPDRRPAATKSVLKTKKEYAAGSLATPIMLSEVKEKDPQELQKFAGSADQKPSRSGAAKATAVEGYVPRALGRPRLAKTSSGRRVRFADEVPEGEHAKPGPSQPEPSQLGLSQAAAAFTSSTTSTVDGPASGAPVLVLELEDAPGPLEGSSHDLASKFGRLRVASAAEVGVDEEELDRMKKAGEMYAAAAAAAAAAQEQPVACGGRAESAGARGGDVVAAAGALETDVELTKKIRRGVRASFPRLAAALQMDASASESDVEEGSEAATEEYEYSDVWVPNPPPPLSVLLNRQDSLLPCCKSKGWLFPDNLCCYRHTLLINRNKPLPPFS